MRYRHLAPRRVVRVAGVAVLLTALAATSLFAQGGLGSTTDPRVGLKAGYTDAGEASSNMRLI